MTYEYMMICLLPNVLVAEGIRRNKKAAIRKCLYLLITALFVVSEKII